ncbi:metal homeostatis BSD2 family protein [Salinibacter ruber]|jgi:hypothetical protein|uniref:metal homeostatis BSD2 family protein n=1 Tax=Salinibacter ruber TaxID=146919 RepID=UPI0021675680|nr:metal homeostatis BSD2 family protein [Salinibacter ruber]MCS3642773.1 hypothetical protein [Salinibacter ruber]MCS3685944.1 hypothetical protein [Salinibacter ruber]
MEGLPTVVKQLIPVIALVVGWFLRGISGFMQIRREERQVLSRAVAGLLEVHSDLATHEKMFRAINNRYDLSPRQKFEFSRWLVRNRPRSETIGERFDEAAKLVASVDPIISHAIRSAKDAHSSLFEGDVFEADQVIEDSYKLAIQSERDAIKRTASRVEKLARKVSFKHSFWLWMKLRLGFIGRRPEDEPDQEFLDKLPRLDDVLENHLQISKQ